jgi:hypothetical protein
VVLVAANGEGFALEGDAAAFAAAVLRALESPTSTVDLEAEILRQTGSPDALPVLSALVQKLVATAIVEEREDPPPPPLGRTPPLARRLVVGVSGAIAAVDAPRLVGILQERGFEVRVAMTAAALRFASRQALAALTHASVTTSALRGRGSSWVPHVELAEWAEAVIVYPASATTLSRIARGDFSDAVSAVALTTRAPVLLAPSMNHAMFASRAVQRNLDALEADGFYVALPSRGREVADAPADRALRGAVALLPERIADLAVALVRATVPVRAPGLADWDRVFASEGPLPWEDDEAYEALVAAIARSVKPGARVLDVGGGTGALAAKLAAAGFRVVMTEVSRAALARAKARLAGHPDVVVVRDDATASQVESEFDAVVDRATLHSLPRSALGGYAESAARWLAPEGRLFVVHDKPSADPSRATLRLSSEELAAALGLVVERGAIDIALDGSGGRAFLTVLSRHMLAL